MMPSVAESGSVSWMPKPLESNVPPKYPADALRMRAEGTAQLRITVSREGQVMEIEIKQSSGWPSLDQAAVEAVSKWRFQRQATMFTSSSQSVILPVRFALNR